MPRFELKGKVNLDGSKWKSGLDQAKRNADTWSKDTSRMIKSRLMTAFAVGAMFRGMTSLFDKAAGLRDEAAKIQVDPESFQVMDYAARQSGASIDNVAKSVKRLSAAQRDVLDGSAEMVDPFLRFGITPETLENNTPVELLDIISKQVEKGVNKESMLADIQAIMGRSGPELIPTFQSGFSGMMQEGRDIGPAFSNEQVMELGETADAWTKTQQEGASALGNLYQGASDLIEKLGPLVALPFDQDARNSVTQMNVLQNKLLENIERNTKATDKNTAPLNQ
jgi:hypothetical protein